MSVRTRTVVLVSQDEVFARRIDIDLAEAGWAVVHAEDAEHAMVRGVQAVVVDGRAAQRGASWRLLEGLRRRSAAVLPMVAVLDAPMPADVLRALNSGATAWVARDETDVGLQPALERALAEQQRPGA